MGLCARWSVGGMLPRELLIHVGLYLSVREAVQWYSLHRCKALGEHVYLESAKSPRGVEEAPRAWSFILRNFAWSRFLRYVDRNPLVRRMPHLYTWMKVWKKGWTPTRSTQRAVTRLIASTFCPTRLSCPSQNFVRMARDGKYFELAFTAGGRSFRLHNALVTCGGVPVAKYYPRDVWYVGAGWTEALARKLFELDRHPGETLLSAVVCPFCGKRWDDGGLSELCMHALASFHSRWGAGQAPRDHQSARVIRV